MTYPFVQSHTDLGPARGPRLAIAWHMAEGGGTVGFLAKANAHGVSVHYVVERSGRIVQMLRETRMHSSIRSTSIRRSDDTPYAWAGATVTYGQTSRTAVMGDWGDVVKTLGPNHASIGVEVEGFAKDGPNADQAAAIGRLWADLSGRHPGIRSLGHRDFASYKACPGRKFPWDVAGGHAPAEDSIVRNFTLLKRPDGKIIPAALTFPDPAASVLILGEKTDRLVKVNTGWVKHGIKVRLKDPIIPGRPRTDDWMLGWLIGKDAAFALDRNVLATPYPGDFNEGVDAVISLAQSVRRT